jgi:hypothetical protein
LKTLFELIASDFDASTSAWRLANHRRNRFYSWNWIWIDSSSTISFHARERPILRALDSNDLATLLRIFSVILALDMNFVETARMPTAAKVVGRHRFHKKSFLLFEIEC